MATALALPPPPRAPSVLHPCRRLPAGPDEHRRRGDAVSILAPIFAVGSVDDFTHFGGLQPTVLMGMALAVSPLGTKNRAYLASAG